MTHKTHYQFRQSEPPTPRLWGHLALILFAMAAFGACNMALGQAGDPKWFFRGSGVGDQTGYVTKVNNSLYAINGSGAFSLLAQSNFANASHSHAFSDLTGKPTTIAGYGITDFNSLGDARWSLLAHTHVSANVTDASLGGNGAADAGLLAKFNAEGQLRAAVENSGLAAIYATSSGSGYAGYFNSSGVAETLKGINGSSGSAISGASYTGHGVDAESTNGIALHVHGVDLAGANVALAEFAEGLSETVKLTIGNDGGLSWSGTGAQTTATNLPAFGSSAKGVVPASGGGTSNFLRADGSWASPGGGSGTVTSVAVSGSDGIEVDSGSPVTSSGTIALGVNASGLKTHLSLGNVENTALSTWAGSSNITTLGTVATGIWQADRIGPTYGGTGQNAYALGDLLYADATDNLARLAGNTTATRSFLSQTGNGSVSAAPAWREITTSDVSGLGTLATQSGTFSGTHSGTSSGTNTGDQTSIVGITGTTAQFNTALSDGDFATGGGTATGTNTGDQTITLTGDVTGSGTGSFAATIATGVIVNADINASAAIALSKLATDPLARANHTGTQAVSTISDATTVGQNLVKLANPSAITYPRMNADNTVTARTMAQSRTDLALHPVTITAITGGSQATTSTSLADVTGSTITFPDTGWYEWEYFIIHSSGATSTGAFFAVNTGGTMVNNYITYCISYDVLSTDKDTYCVDGYNSVIASTSSRATANNRSRMQGTIHVTTAGGMVLRFATEVNASAITVTELSGWYRNL